MCFYNFLIAVAVLTGGKAATAAPAAIIGRMRELFASCGERRGLNSLVMEQWRRPTMSTRAAGSTYEQRRALPVFVLPIQKTASTATLRRCDVTTLRCCRVEFAMLQLLLLKQVQGLASSRLQFCSLLFAALQCTKCIYIVGSYFTCLCFVIVAALSFHFREAAAFSINSYLETLICIACILGFRAEGGASFAFRDSFSWVRKSGSFLLALPTHKAF